MEVSAWTQCVGGKSHMLVDEAVRGVGIERVMDHWCQQFSLAVGSTLSVSTYGRLTTINPLSTDLILKTDLDLAIESGGSWSIWTYC